MAEPESRDAGYEKFPESAAELLGKWDAGETVWTIEMGGIGPGYEQAIQVLAFELIRDFLLIDDWDAISEEELQQRRDGVYDRHFKGEGYSGAQVGAATNLAVKFVRAGPHKAVEELDDSERHTLVSRAFPQAPVVPDALLEALEKEES